MTVQDLIDALSKEEPSAEVWVQLDGQKDRFDNLMPVVAVTVLGDEFVNKDANEEDVVICYKASQENPCSRIC